MNNKYCHRCLMCFNRDSRIIEHIIKKNKCEIINNYYNVKYEDKLLSLFQKYKTELIKDFDKYVTELDDLYQCIRCHHKLSNKSDMNRHLMQSCLKDKYVISGELSDLLQQSKQPNIELFPKIKIKPKLINKNVSVSNDEYHIYNDYILQIDDNGDKYKCLICNHIFEYKEEIYLHVKNICVDNMINNINKLPASLLDSKIQSANLIKSLNHNEKNYEQMFMSMKSEIKKEMEEVNHRMSVIEKKPQTVNNLQVLCLDSNKNCLDALTERFGNFSQALDFVKGCALSQLSGDVRLIEHVYLNSQRPAMWFLDRKRHKIGWIDENGQKNIDIGGRIVLRKLVSNLQNGYLKGVNYLISQNLDENRCPNKFLADYDIQSWNSHIYNLCEEKYQNKLLNHLDLPTLIENNN